MNTIWCFLSFAMADDVPVSLEETVTRDIFVSLIKDMVNSTEKQINIVLTDSGLKASDIDLILLVGGSTRIPYVKEFVEKLLARKQISLLILIFRLLEGFYSSRYFKPGTFC